MALEAINTMRKTQKELNNIHFGKVECQLNHWSAMRFNITSVPYIVLIDANKMYEFKSYPTAKMIHHFLTEEKTLEEALSVPPPMNYMKIVVKILNESFGLLNHHIESFINEKLNLEIKWKTRYTLIIFLCSLVLIVAIEYFFILCCCGKSSKKEVKPEIKTE